MATYDELRAEFSDDGLRNRVEVATLIAANNLLSGTPSINEQKWAAAVFADPGSEGRKAFLAVLAARSGATITDIQGASDAAIQSNVDAIVGSLVVAFNA